MKTAEEKAKELVERFKPFSHFWVHDLGRQKDYDIEQFENAKECALICIDEKIELIKSLPISDLMKQEIIKVWKRKFFII